jgi:hypothetical protein
MDYPRELRLSAEREAALISYLNDEILAHAAERATWVTDLQSWQEDYWATPATKEATFPFKNAANIIIPLTAIAVESVHAREMTTLFALDQFVATQVLDPNSQNLTYDLDKAIDWELLKGVDIYKFCDQALLPNKKLGTCVGKTGYEKIIKTAVKEVGGEEQDFTVIIKQGPTADSIPLANFLMPFTATDPQLAPWCGEEHLENLYQVKLKCESGFFREEVMDKLTTFFSSSPQLSSTPYTNTMRKMQDQTPIQWPREIGWHEMWLAFDIDGSGKEKEIVVHYHQPSQTFFSIRYNWWDDLRRHYEIGNYFPLENRWAGIGIGKQNEQFQAEVTTQHRQRIDNATLANLRMYKVKQGIGIGPDEPVFPGKIWLLDDMNDVDSIQMGEIYPSAYNNEQQAVIYSQQRSGVNELTLGMPQVGTPGTATGDMTRVQEFNRKFDYTFKNSKRFTLNIVKNLLCAQSQFGFRNRTYFDTLGQNGGRVMELLSLPADQIRSELVFSLNLVGQNQNRLLDRQNYTQYSQMLTQYYTQMYTLAQQTMPQLLPIIAAKAFQAATEAMKQISEGFDIRGTDRFLLPDQLIQSLMQMTAGQNGSQQPGLIGAGSQGSQNSSQTSGVRDPNAINQQTG